MDTKELIAQAKARYNHQQSRVALQSKYSAELTITYGGGLWEVTPDLIAFLSALSSRNVVLQDSYNNPIKVKRKELLELLKTKYNTVMLEWYNEQQSLSKLR